MCELELRSDQSKLVRLTASRHIRLVGVRFRKAVGVAMPFFIGAVVGIFIPVLHFVIVPVASVVGLVLATRELTTRYSFTIQTIDCPHCSTSYGETELARLPKRLMCFNCRIASTLTEVEPL